MNLAQRAALLARAKPGDTWARQIALTAAIALLTGAFALGPIWIGIPAALVIGLCANRDPERYYLEGFSDGLAASAVSEAGRPADAGPGSGDVGVVPPDAGANRLGAGRDGATVRPSHRGFREVAGRGQEPDQFDAFGVPRPAGPPRSPLDTEGRPIPGPTRPSAGAVPAASRVGAPVRIPPARAATGAEADDR